MTALEKNTIKHLENILWIHNNKWFTVRHLRHLLCLSGLVLPENIVKNALDLIVTTNSNKHAMLYRFSKHESHDYYICVILN